MKVLKSFLWKFWEQQRRRNFWIYDWNLQSFKHFCRCKLRSQN